MKISETPKTFLLDDLNNHIRDLLNDPSLVLTSMTKVNNHDLELIIQAFEAAREKIKVQV